MAGRLRKFGRLWAFGWLLAGLGLLGGGLWVTVGPGWMCVVLGVLVLVDLWDDSR